MMLSSPGDLLRKTAFAEEGIWDVNCEGLKRESLLHLFSET